MNIVMCVKSGNKSVLHYFVDVYLVFLL